MTPDLLEQGARRIEERRAALEAGKANTESGGRSASGSRVAHPTGEVDVTHGRILYLEDVSVSFDGFKAINKLSLDIAPGELRCIIGPNGAGKTTMMDIITGKTRPDEGTVFFGSTIDLLRHKEAEIAQLGIGRKFQKPTVFEQLTVFENLELALKTNKGEIECQRPLRCPGGRSRGVRAGGHQKSMPVASGVPGGGGQVKGTTPLPARASARRCESPVVVTR